MTQPQHALSPVDALLREHGLLDAHSLPYGGAHVRVTVGGHPGLLLRERPDHARAHDDAMLAGHVEQQDVAFL